VPGLQPLTLRASMSLDGTKKPRRVVGRAGLDLNFLGDLKGIVDFDAKIPHGGFNLRMHHAQVAGPAVDQRRFGSTQGMRRELARVETMRKYSLSRHPAEHYSKYFSPDALVFVPYRGAGWYDLVAFKPVDDPGCRTDIVCLNEQPERYSCRVGEDLLAFCLYIASHDGAVDPELVAIAQEVLAHIVELDLFASDIDPRDESQAQLLDVDITRETVFLRYGATTWNSEWGTAFKRVGPGEFEYLGPRL